MTIEFDPKIVHHFSDGLYAKEFVIPKDHFIVSHKHTYSHLSILSKGSVIVKVGDYTNNYAAPACIEIKADENHTIIALEDCVWFCIHATDEKDEAKIDEVLIKKE